MRLMPKSKFTWLLLLLMAYAYYNEYGNKVSAITNPKPATQSASGDVSVPAPESSSFTEKIVEQIKQNDTGKVIIEALAKKSLEDKYGKSEAREIAAINSGTLAIVDVIRGSGATLRCGASAVINYDAYMSSGIQFDSTKSPKGGGAITVITGHNQVIKGLEAGIVGMSEGGRRKISIPPELAFNMPGFNNSVVEKKEVISYDVELVSIKKGSYNNDLVLKTASEVAGGGASVLCGDKVKIKYNLKTVAGVPLASGVGEVEFKLGFGNVPMGFEDAVTGMKVGGKKSVTIPYSLLKIAGQNFLPGSLEFASGQAVQADFEVLASQNAVLEK